MVLFTSHVFCVPEEQVRRQAIVFTDSIGAGDLSRLEKAILSAIERSEKDSTHVNDSDLSQRKVRFLTDAMGLEERAEALNSFR